MPAGTYLYDDGTTERFQCAPGPAGWRYVGQGTDTSRVDVAVDSRWRPARVELLAGGWRLRGGVSGPDTIWLRAAAADLAEASEHRTAALGFFGRSPGLLIPAARSLKLAVGASALVRLVEVTEPVLATRTVDQEWTLRDVTTHDGADGAALPVERYQLTDLSTGESTELYLSGDVALSGPGVELHDLASPPHGIREGENP
ncbi:MAG: hypothetical protein WCB04_14115 [Mycobacteriales bacterium]